ncbi:alpha/beta hydrolase [Aquimarina sp. AU119]|uniref:alpha/beta hydrolase n=1 Tax=Aquimarina sp. AU119 TaxID=2108528 RepID=UPI000D698A45|nr:alpha/beta hydrolase [Aquimarina sp. AU119]
MKPRLIVLSDIWGIEKSDWVVNYVKILETEFDIKYYDSCKLGKVSKNIYEESSLHSQFLERGISTATDRLLELEKGKVTILAFSIGGTIAWKAALKGLDVNKFYAISSTRLRYETTKPEGCIKLFFGEHDDFKPKTSWFEQLRVDHEISRGKKHQMYTDKNYAIKISNEIKRRVNIQ